MLGFVTRRFRVRAAIVTAAVYALCAIAPHAALAITNGAIALHCMTEFRVAGGHADHAAMGHTHADASMDMAAHDHHGSGTPPAHSDGGKSNVANCCGLFCASALANEPYLGIEMAFSVSSDFVGPSTSLTGRAPERLYRPPIV